MQNRGGLILQDPNNLKPAIGFSAIRGDAVSDLFLGVAVDEEQRIPSEVHNLSKLTDWRNYNNHANTCVPAAWAHQRHLVTSLLQAPVEYPTYQQVLELYKTVNPVEDTTAVTVKDADAHVNFYLPSDHGIAMQAMLDELCDHKVPGRSPLRFFARAESPTMHDVSEAIAIFDSVLLEVIAFDNNINSEPWTTPDPLPKEVNSGFGHAVLAGGYSLKSETVEAISWGKVVTLDKKWWDTKVYRLGSLKPIVHAMWIAIWPEQVTTRAFELGVNSERLKAEFKKLTKEDLPLDG